MFCIGVKLDDFNPKDWHIQDVLDWQVLIGVFHINRKDHNNSAEKSMMISINLFFFKLCDRTEKSDIYETFNMCKQNNKCVQHFSGET